MSSSHINLLIAEALDFFLEAVCNDIPAEYNFTTCETEVNVVVAIRYLSHGYISYNSDISYVSYISYIRQ